MLYCSPHALTAHFEDSLLTRALVAMSGYPQPVTSTQDTLLAYIIIIR